MPGVLEDIDIPILADQTPYSLDLVRIPDKFFDEGIGIFEYLQYGFFVHGRLAGNQIIRITGHYRQTLELSNVVELRWPAIVLLIVAGRTKQGRIVGSEWPEQASGQGMVQVDLFPVGQSAPAIEACATEFPVDLGTVDVAGSSRQALVETPPLSRFTVLVGDARLVLDSIVERLAEPALALPA